MGDRGRNRGRNSHRRKAGALNAMEKLSSILRDRGNLSTEISDSAARQLIGVGRKHGVRPDAHVSRLICRACKMSMIPGKSARVRISSGIVTTTCLRCERVKRVGPDF
ncbi:MAG: ribonuclease P Rpr2/Rpp21/SNM1 subunit [Candidatus Thalassarchaeaceae archaeon]|jgi:RNase P subunit RPR2|nr:ribonuclease P Rpr2/Rpp21/SNM1 subunit [Candidatus Thalassarchaeaceae archaeon]